MCKVVNHGKTNLALLDISQWMSQREMLISVRGRGVVTFCEVQKLSVLRKGILEELFG